MMASDYEHTTSYGELRRWAFEITPKFWALIPAVNINLWTQELEFEWLCFGFYIRFFKPLK